MRSGRLEWLDGMRGLAILWIVFVHFVSIFTPNGNVVFPGIWGLLLFGISGKLAVAGCCVILGYFASKPSPLPVWKYSLRRYLLFALQILLMELIHLPIARDYSLGWYAQSFVPELAWPFSAQIPLILEDVFLFKARLIPTYWCVGDFVLGSIVVFALVRWTEKLPLAARMLICLAVIAGLIALEEIWIAICLMGWLLRLLTECRIPFSKSPFFWIVLLAFVPWMIRRGECPRTYLLDGAASVLVLYVLSQWSWMQKVLSFRPLAWVGTITLELFIVHVPLLELIRVLIDDLCNLPLTILHHGIMFVLLLALSLLAAAGWRRGIRLLLSAPKYPVRKKTT